MDKNAVGVGSIIVLAIAMIVGAILLQASAQNVGSMSNTVTPANVSLSTVVNDTAQYITTYRALSGVVIFNETNGTAGFVGDVVGSGNYTVTNNVVNNGALAVRILPDANSDVKSAWVVSATSAQPLTYSDDSASRNVAALIIILMALAMVAVAVGAGIKGEMFK